MNAGGGFEEGAVEGLGGGVAVDFHDKTVDATEEGAALLLIAELLAKGGGCGV